MWSFGIQISGWKVVLGLAGVRRGDSETGIVFDGCKEVKQ